MKVANSNEGNLAISSDTALGLLQKLRNEYLPELITLHSDCIWLRSKLGLDDKRDLQTSESRLLQFITIVDSVINQIQNFTTVDALQDDGKVLKTLEAKISKAIMPVKARLLERLQQTHDEDNKSPSSTLCEKKRSPPPNCVQTTVDHGKIEQPSVQIVNPQVPRYVLSSKLTIANNLVIPNMPPGSGNRPPIRSNSYHHFSAIQMAAQNEQAALDRKNGTDKRNGSGRRVASKSTDKKLKASTSIAAVNPSSLPPPVLTIYPSNPKPLHVYSNLVGSSAVKLSEINYVEVPIQPPILQQQSYKHPNESVVVQLVQKTESNHSIGNNKMHGATVDAPREQLLSSEPPSAAVMPHQQSITDLNVEAKISEIRNRDTQIVDTDSQLSLSRVDMEHAAQRSLKPQSCYDVALGSNSPNASQLDNQPQTSVVTSTATTVSTESVFHVSVQKAAESVLLSSPTTIASSSSRHSNVTEVPPLPPQFVELEKRDSYIQFSMEALSDQKALSDVSDATTCAVPSSVAPERSVSYRKKSEGSVTGRKNAKKQKPGVDNVDDDFPLTDEGFPELQGIAEQEHSIFAIHAHDDEHYDFGLDDNVGFWDDGIAGETKPKKSKKAYKRRSSNQANSNNNLSDGSHKRLFHQIEADVVDHDQQTNSDEVAQQQQVEATAGLDLALGGDSLKDDSEYMSSRRRRKLSQIVPNPRKPRLADYNCSVCSEPYSMTVIENPWWAVFHHECKKCGSVQVPRINIGADSNAIELDPNVVALYGEGVSDSGDDGEGDDYTDDDELDDDAQSQSSNVHNEVVASGGVEKNDAHVDESVDFMQVEGDPVRKLDVDRDMAATDESETGSSHLDLSKTKRSEEERAFDGDGLLDKEEASKLLVLMCHARTCEGEHSSERHAEICKSTKFLMLHIRDCRGTDVVTGRECQFPWCGPCKKMIRHLTQCFEPDTCIVCNPWTLPESFQQLRKLNQVKYCQPVEL